MTYWKNLLTKIVLTIVVGTAIWYWGYSARECPSVKPDKQKIDSLQRVANQSNKRVTRLEIKSDSLRSLADSLSNRSKKIDTIIQTRYEDIQDINTDNLSDDSLYKFGANIRIR